MNLIQSPLIYIVIMCIAGMGIPVMATLNADLSSKLNSPALATVILFLIGGSVATLYLLITEGVPKVAINKPIPIMSYLGGLFIIFYIASVTWIAPKIGIGNAIAMVLLGQMISMTVIDHYGLWGALQYAVSKQRLAGLALMAVGVFLVMKQG